MSVRVLVAIALAAAVGLATAISPLASTSPDGLTKVAEDKAFADTGRLHSLQEDSPMPGYAFPGIDNEKVAKGVAGFVGTLGVFAIGSGIAYVARRGGRRDGSARSPGATA
jgi:hypothetical protein